MKELKRQVHSENSIRIMQFGAGNFLRAFTNWMIDVLNEETAFNGDVLIIKPTEKGDYKSLRNQDGLYHVLTRGIKNGKEIDDLKCINCVQQIIHPYKEFEKYLQSAHFDNIRFIFSNTTESGIRFNKEDRLDDTPALEYPGKLTQWLFERFKHFKGQKDKGCIIIPCELIKDNGVATKQMILNYIDSWDLEGEFLNWIEKSCIFCNTLVDRIVTGFPHNDAEGIFNRIGSKDKLLTSAEPYHLFVIEGPENIKVELPFHKTDLNVIFTNNLTKYREIKVRILNGAHTALVPVAYLSGFRTVGEAIRDPEINKYIQQLIGENILLTLDYQEDELKQYSKDVLERFKNPFIEHKLMDISLNSISKFGTRLLPSLLAYVSRKNELPQYIVKALAALIVFYKGEYGGEIIQLRDSGQVIDYFEKQWSMVNTNDDIIKFTESVLANEKLWDLNLNNIPGLTSAVSAQIGLFLQ